MNESADYRTIASSIRFLEENFQSQPSLDALASRAGMSRFHFQRLFTRWAGVSPKRFLQFLTVEHAKERLRDSEPVLRAAFAAGLSGPARLHDLFVTVEGVTPGEFKGAGAALEIRWGIHPTPFGPALLARTQRGLCHLAFLEDGRDGEGGEGGKSVEDGETGRGRKDADGLSPADSSASESLVALEGEWPSAILTEDPGATASLARSIFHPGQTDAPPQPLSLFLKGTNFQIKVWNALLRIPSGSVTTYGQLAGAIGQPSAARAVGSAVGKNPIAYLIPCHRVIRQMGALGQYRWGAVRKQAILGWEAARKVS